MAKTKAAFEGVTFDADPETELVNVRVLKRGDGKISTGVHDNRGGDILFEAGEQFRVARHIAETLEGHGYVEIDEAKADRPQLDHDHDGHPGGSLPRRGRPPKVADE